ncbi:MAG: hypothetical protein OXG77_01425 [Chloroflexi bacterium]|nr:hypothetical protein [Chloroflexota bacterium]
MMAAQPTFTENARSDLKRYLRRVRHALRPHPSVDADEVELEIKGHIEAELAGELAPVTAERLHGVLDRLGSPNDWVPDDDLPAWRKLLLRLRTGPEDWRLAYLSISLFIICSIVAPATHSAAAPLLLIASFLVARAGLKVLEEHNESPGARKWFFYPPLVFVYLVIGIMATILPLAVAVGMASDANLPADLYGLRGILVEWIVLPTWFGATLLVVLVTGVWWLAIGLVLARLTRAVRAVFWPFAERLRERHGLRIALAGAASAAPSGLTLALMA